MSSNTMALKARLPLGSITTRAISTTLSTSIGPAITQNAKGTKTRARDWSGNISFANPEADFVTASPQEIQQRRVRTVAEVGKDWSGKISFANPEADFVAPSLNELQQRHKRTIAEAGTDWSGKISFVSPEADIVAPTPREMQKRDVGTVAEVGKDWSGNFSFASPEADFCTASLRLEQDEDSGPSWSGQISFASPESDFCFKADQNEQAETQSLREEDRWSRLLSFTSPEADFTSPHLLDLLDERMKRQPHESSDQLAKYDTRRELESTEKAKVEDYAETEELAVGKEESRSVNELYAAIDSVPLPSNLSEALRPTKRAIVVTETAAPFRIVDVNDAWVGLCGYSREESIGKTLDSLLQGPETDKSAVKAVVEDLLKGHEAGTVLTNYNKKGRKFHNRVRMGALRDERDKVTHFVGVLREVTEMVDHFTEEHKMAK